MQTTGFHRFVRLVGFLIVAFVLPVTGAEAARAQQATPTPEAEPSWLMIQAFDEATLRLDPSTNTSTLTLTGVDAAMLAFTDRPNRKVATVLTADFAQLVSDAQADPLNAALVAPLDSGAAVMVVVELRTVEFDATGSSVTYQVAVLAEEGGKLTAVDSPLASPNTEAAFGSGHLFVDDVQVPVRVPINVCGNIVNVIGELNPSVGNTCENA